MYPLAIVGALLIAFMLVFSQSIISEHESNYRREVQTLSSNAAIYLDRAKAFVRANPGFTGLVSDANIDLPTWYKKMDGINCYASGGVGYLYLSGDKRKSADALDLMGLQYPYGIKSGGIVVGSNLGDSFSVPDAIPNGSFVVKF